MSHLSRRLFTLGATALSATSFFAPCAFAQGATRTVTTSLGTYEIPANPQRVVAVDSRLDLQPALALGLPVIGYGHSVPGDWVPVSSDAQFYGSILNVEQVLQAAPDLIICADYDRDSEYWPLNKMRQIAPVLPTNGEQSWKQSLRDLAAFLGMDGAGDSALGEYETEVAAVKAKHGDKLTTRTVVSVQPDAGAVWPMNGSTQLHTQVLADLGARTIPPKADQRYEDAQVSAENFADYFSEVDGVLLATTGTEEIDTLRKEPLWSRLPFVEAGAVVASNGNVNYGSIYSARHLVHLSTLR